MWVDIVPANAEKLVKAIDAFGYDTKILEGVDLNHQPPVKLSEGLNRIEILPNLQGNFSFEEAYQRRKVIKSKRNICQRNRIDVGDFN